VGTLGDGANAKEVTLALLTLLQHD
jgi:hypothetical protein